MYVLCHCPGGGYFSAKPELVDHGHICLQECDTNVLTYPHRVTSYEEYLHRLTKILLNIFRNWHANQMHLCF